MEIEGTEIAGIAHNVRDAWPSIQKTKPDLTILGICLPDGNGIDVLKKIRAAGLSTKVYMCTYAYAQYKKRCLDLGADYFLDKYSDYEKLLAVVGDLVKAKNAGAVPPGAAPAGSAQIR
jgi:DNA-binding NarL/FixJ family response regulator